VTCLAALFVAVGFVMMTKAPAPGPIRADQIVKAVRAYATDLQRQQAVAPAAVSLDELVAKGYLQAADVRAFSGIRTRVHLPPYDESQPAKVLMEASLPDGHRLLVLNDGSVQSRQFQR
jgi:hypothetical protein